MDEPSPNVWNRPLKGRRGLFLSYALLVAALFVIVFCFCLLQETRRSVMTDASYSLLLAMVLSAIVIVVLSILRWLLCWRNLRRVLFAAACLLTLVALFLTEENLRGRRAWENHRRAAEARGEPFTLASLVPPPVPDEKNFALTPLLKSALDYTNTPEGIRWRDTNSIAHLYTIRVDLSSPGDDRRALDPAIGALEKGTFTDLEASRNFYRGNSNYPQPSASGAAANDVLVALGRFDADLNELRNAAATRPQCRFPIHYEDEPSFAILLPHLAHVKGIASVFELRAIALLESQRVPEAFQDLKMTLRLSDCISNEPVLVDLMVRNVILRLGLQTLREGLARHAWNDAQLAELGNYFASLNLLGEFRMGLFGERALATSGLDYYRRNRWHLNALDLVDSNESIPILAVMLGRVPGGFYYQNMCAIADLHEQHTLKSVNERERRIFPDRAEEMDREFGALRRSAEWHPYKFFARLFTDKLSRITVRAGQAQTFVDEARVACALERFRLAHGRLPETLNALAPEFLPAVPNDVVDGRPLRYRVTADGGYTLYSIGWNGADDGGKIGIDSKERDRFGEAATMGAKTGDWAWSLPGKL